MQKHEIYCQYRSFEVGNYAKITLEIRDNSKNQSPVNFVLLDIIINLLNDRDKLPKQTITSKADGKRGDTRSISIPAITALEVHFCWQISRPVDRIQMKLGS